MIDAIAYQLTFCGIITDIFYFYSLKQRNKLETSWGSVINDQIRS